MNEGTSLAVRQETAIEPEPESLLFAINREQMVHSQEKMRLWLQARIKVERQRARELAENLEIATRNKWSVKPIRSRLATVKKKVEFFSKFLAAVEAGYHPIPDLQMDIFAIRTKRAKPLPKYKEMTILWGSPSVPDEDAQRLPQGEGEYRNPAQLVRRGARKEIQNGKEVELKWVQATRFQDVIDFPFTLVKPELLNETQRAMALRVFDEVGVIQPRTGVRGDPIIAGRIRSWTTSGRDALFLIGWYVDMLEFGR